MWLLYSARIIPQNVFTASRVNPRLDWRRWRKRNLHLGVPAEDTPWRNELLQNIYKSYEMIYVCVSPNKKVNPILYNSLVIWVEASSICIIFWHRNSECWMKWKGREHDWFQLNTKGFAGGRQPAKQSCGGAIGIETGLREVWDG